MSSVRARVLGECSIDVGSHSIAPDSPQLFATTLYLCYSDGRPIRRTELVDLVCPADRDRRKSTHNLRQLLYRLRLLGTPLEVKGDVVRLHRDAVTSSLDQYLSVGRDARLSIPSSQLSILPSYEPQITTQLTDWVETTRSHLASRVRAVLREDFRSYQSECRWEQVVSVAELLRDLDVASGELAAGIATGLFMLGRKDDALDALDSYLSDNDSPNGQELRRLRQKLAKSQCHLRARESGFHGREEVMEALGKQWRRTVLPSQQLAVITGPAGIGKSRVAREFTSYAKLNGGYCLEYHCDKSDSGRPLSLFHSLLPLLRSMRGCLGTTPSLQKHLLRLTGEASPEGPWESATSEATRADIQLALLDLLDAVASETPLAIWVDDAHHLDAASAAILDALVGRREPTAVMLICCHRAGDAGVMLRTDPTRLHLYQLAPLDDSASMRVIQELLPHGQSNKDFLRQCVSQSGGNPYYLHAIAFASRSDRLSDPSPFDIKQFAAISYYSLAPEAKTFFEVCLLLGSFATIDRVRAIADIDGPQLVNALRSLETGGMLFCSGSELRCAHALLEEASRPLIPNGVAALLHQQIAQHLERECASGGHPTDLTWAAAENWIAAGNAQRAATLLSRCAAQAAAVGEVHSAAQALLRIPLDQLSAVDRPAILNKLIEYSDAAGDRDQVLSSLRLLQSSVREIGADESTVSEIDFRVIEADLRHGGSPERLIVPLYDMLTDDNAPLALRLRAGIRLLIAADVTLDIRLADSVYRVLPVVTSQSDVLAPLRHQADIVYHTVFGEQAHALQLIKRVIDQHPNPDIAQLGVSSRRNAGYALNRMGRGDLARPILVADCAYMLQRHVLSEAMFSMIVLAESALYDGDLATTRTWLQKAAGILEHAPQSRALRGGYYSAAAGLAIIEGQFSMAEHFVDQAHAHFPAIRSPRFEAIEIALRLRIALARGETDPNPTSVARLRELYGHGARLGAQDTVVEVLWLVETVRGRSVAAHELLAEYLTKLRRERAMPEWSLRVTTGTDPAWHTQAISS
jgi:DNA-binding SARP family transcriptional activator